ncbi:hypothetical protein [Phaeodactylibacter xiamenensis]|uniref:hypothetical protein n=1 Tax=Phaeodactylibacter xiamenensis TaxID=1524460 RepID=UPI003CCB78F5
MDKHIMKVRGNRIYLTYMNAEEDTVQTETFLRVPNYITEFWMNYTSMKGNSTARFTGIEMSYQETREHIRKNWLPKLPLGEQITIRQFFSM